MRPVAVLLATFASSVLTDDGEVTYDGFSVLELVPRSDPELRWLQGRACSSLTDWVGPGQPAHLLCNRREARQLRGAARRRGLPVRFVSRQLGREIRAERRTLDIMDGPGTLAGRETAGKRKRPNPHTIKQSFKHRSYLGSQLMFEFLEQLVETYSNVTTMETLATTAEGRDLKLVKINAGGNSSSSSLPVIFIGNTH